MKVNMKLVASNASFIFSMGCYHRFVCALLWNVHVQLKHLKRAVNVRRIYYNLTNTINKTF